MSEPPVPGSSLNESGDFEEVSEPSSEQVKLLEGFIKLAGMMLQASRADLLLCNSATKEFVPFRSYQSSVRPRRGRRDHSRETRPLSSPGSRRNELPFVLGQTETEKPEPASDQFDRFLANYASNEGHLLSYPITIDDQPFAFFKAEEREDGQPFGDREQTMLELLVAQLLVGLRAEAFLNNNSANNSLVLPGEEFLQAQLPGELERARRHNFNLSLMSLALNVSFADLLPSSSDLEAGRTYLQEIFRHIARALRRNLRSFDLVCQNEANEFSIVLPHTNELEAYAVARKLISQLEDDISLAPSARKALALMIGISTYPILANGAPVLIKQSRQALSQARKPKLHGHSIFIWGSSRSFDLNRLNEIRDEAVARAMLRGFNYISLSAPTTTILPNAVPWEISRQYLCLAVQERQAVLTVAMADPSDSAVITLLARTTGRSIVPMVSTRTEILAALDYITRQRQQH